jgi:hypothetical protein
MKTVLFTACVVVCFVTLWVVVAVAEASHNPREASQERVGSTRTPSSGVGTPPVEGKGLQAVEVALFAPDKFNVVIRATWTAESKEAADLTAEFLRDRGTQRKREDYPVTSWKVDVKQEGKLWRTDVRIVLDGVKWEDATTIWRDVTGIAQDRDGFSASLTVKR